MDSYKIEKLKGFYDFFSLSPIELDERFFDIKTLQDVLDTIKEKQSSHVTELSASNLLIELIKEKQSLPDKVPAMLESFITACKETALFPLWSFALHTLAYYDKRQHINAWLGNMIDRTSELPEALKFVLAEASLECTHHTTFFKSLVSNIDCNNCQPLVPEIASFWQQWLQGEFSFYQGRDKSSVEQIEARLNSLIEKHIDDTFFIKEYKRLQRRATLLCLRSCLAQGNMDKACQWIDIAGKHDAGLWEVYYFKALLAWADNKYLDAQKLLEQSLMENPFQSRVRFELAMLLSCQDKKDAVINLEEAMPDVHDAEAALAIQLCHCGYEEKAQSHLNKLDDPESPYALYLILPEAAKERICQAKALQVYLGEKHRDWYKAIKHLDEISDFSCKTVKADALVHRLYRLYLLRQHIKEQKHDTQGYKELVTYFNKESGKMSIRPLLGDAMFYRALAVAENMPERAIRDCQALLRQSKWIKKTYKRSPQKILHIGDYLFRQELFNEAYRAYKIVQKTFTTMAEERIFAIEILKNPPDIETLIAVLKEQKYFDKAFCLFLLGFCYLAKEESDFGQGQSLFQEALDIGLPPHLKQVSEQLLTITYNDTDKPLAIADIINNATCPALKVTVEILFQPNGTTTLKAFKKIYGNNWIELCPIEPQSIVAKEIDEYCSKNNYKAALIEIEEAEDLGINIPIQWKSFLQISHAIELALQGNFEEAETFLNNLPKSLFKKEGLN